MAFLGPTGEDTLVPVKAGCSSVGECQGRKEGGGGMGRRKRKGGRDEVGIRKSGRSPGLERKVEQEMSKGGGRMEQEEEGKPKEKLQESW